MAEMASGLWGFGGGGFWVSRWPGFGAGVGMLHSREAGKAEQALLSKLPG